MNGLKEVPHKIKTTQEGMQVKPRQKEELEKQGYRLVGHHSAVKICGWTKNMLLSKGGCYKFTFYGIRSHQCMQMTTSMFCASRCVFCWRGEKAPVSKEWYGVLDQPESVLQQALEEHQLLLTGFRGNPKARKYLVKQMANVRHVALSLTGEPITYPLLNEFIRRCHEQKISTFLVSNAQYPEEIEKIKTVTQLYLSIDAPNLELFKKVDRPLFKDYDERMLKSLDVLATRKYRTCIRLTCVKNWNMTDIKGYAQLIQRGNPDFIEIKGYMFVGESQKWLKYENMPTMDEVRDFSKEVEKELPDYEFVDEHNASRVCLLMRKSFEKKKWINFPKYFEEVQKNNFSLEAKDYSEVRMCKNE